MKLNASLEPDRGSAWLNNSQSGWKLKNVIRLKQNVIEKEESG